MSGALGEPEQVEHHYRYDPAKSLAYTATTLAWLGDAAAEPYAREVIQRLSPGDDISQWPRRVASANIDLALVLLASNRLDEACSSAQNAILSGRVVPSNHWRALEVVKAVEKRELPEGADLREAYQGMRAIEVAGTNAESPCIRRQSWQRMQGLRCGYAASSVRMRWARA